MHTLNYFLKNDFNETVDSNEYPSPLLDIKRIKATPNEIENRQTCYYTSCFSLLRLQLQNTID